MSATTTTTSTTTTTTTTTGYYYGVCGVFIHFFFFFFGFSFLISGRSVARQQLLATSLRLDNRAPLGAGYFSASGLLLAKSGFGGLNKIFNLAAPHLSDQGGAGVDSELSAVASVLLGISKGAQCP